MMRWSKDYIDFCKYCYKFFGTTDYVLINIQVWGGVFFFNFHGLRLVIPVCRTLRIGEDVVVNEDVV